MGASDLQPTNTSGARQMGAEGFSCTLNLPADKTLTESSRAAQQDRELAGADLAAVQFENLRLRRLVAELLLKNQQLRAAFEGEQEQSSVL